MSCLVVEEKKDLTVSLYRLFLGCLLTYLAHSIQHVFHLCREAILDVCSQELSVMSLARSAIWNIRRSYRSAFRTSSNLEMPQYWSRLA